MYAGIDLGTSGCRLIIIDEDGSSCYENKIRYAPKQPQTPTLWLQSVFTLIENVPLSTRLQLEALAIDGTSGTIMLGDQYGTPSSPVRMYNDTCHAQTTKLIRDIAPTTSAAHGASSSLGKLIDLLSHHPSHQHRHVYHQADWMAAQFTQQHGFSDENNCLKIGYDPIKRRWPDWIKETGIDTALLPQVQAPSTPFARIDAKVAKRLALPPNLIVAAGTTDSIAAFLATGASNVGDAVTSLGSTLSLKVIAKQPIYEPNLGVYSHRLWDQWLVGGSSNTGGAVLLQHFTEAQMQSMTPELTPMQSTGLHYYPLPRKGERFPIADPTLLPRLSPKPESDLIFFQGLLEGIADIESLAYRTLQRLGSPYPSKLYSVGGGSQNVMWTIIREQKLGLGITTPKIHEAAYGSALLAKKACMSSIA